MRKKLITGTLITLITLSASASSFKIAKIGFSSYVYSLSDSIPNIQLDPISVKPRHRRRYHHLNRRYIRLMIKVRKVYPYAKKAAQLLAKYDSLYQANPSGKDKRQYLHQAEKDLFKKYGPQLKKLSISEGRILIKLIDRETSHTSYALIRDLKGGLSAFFWQGIAKLFGNDLKSRYDPKNNPEDYRIERIIQRINKT